MLLQGYTDGEYVVASVAHHDCAEYNNILHDGGQPTTNEYAGYTRSSKHKMIWFKVPQTYAELYYDYMYNKVRAYGVWKLGNVEVVEDIPQTVEDFNKLKFENTIWGTRGKNGDEPLKFFHLVDCDTEHLKKILELRHTSPSIVDTANKILKTRIP